MHLTALSTPFVGIPANVGKFENKLHYVGGDANGVRKLLLMTKLTLFLLLTTCMMAAARTGAQTVSISVKNAPLKEVFRQIQKQTGMNIMVKQSLLEKAGKVTVQVKNASVSEVLRLCLDRQPLSYEIDGNTIIIKPKDDLSPAGGGGRRPGVDDLQLPPPIDIKGRVTNETGEPVAASILVKGTNQGTTTNNEGYFELKGVDENATLVISGVSIETREVRVNNQRELVIAATTKVTSLNEVVINKGYYTEKRRLTTGNVSTITAKDIEKLPVNNVLVALQGRVPGIFIQQVNGLPNGAVKVRIQGQNSIGNQSEPLYVVDGVQIPSVLPTTLGQNILGGDRGNPLNFLNPQDIDRIDILKDADATAIYGSRGANGVVVITTKKGKAGKTNVGFNFWQGWGEVAHYMKMLNARQYLDMRYEALKNDGININNISQTNSGYFDLKVWDTSRSTNWQKELIGKNAKTLNANISLTGGNSILRYLISGTYNKQTTVFPGNFDDQRYAFHSSINSISPDSKLEVGLSTSYLFDENRLPRVDLTETAVQLEPVAPALYNSDGSLNWAPTPAGRSTWTNPLQYIYGQYENSTKNLVSNLYLNYQLFKRIRIKTAFGYNHNETDDFESSPTITIRPESRVTSKNSALYGNSNMTSWIAEPQLTYEALLGNGRLDFLFGMTFLERTSKSNALRGSNYSSDELLKNPQAAAQISILEPTFSEYKYSAAFARVNYNLKERYVLNLTARRDGSSRFGRENQFHNFGSIGGAWIFSKEQFLLNNKSLLSFGKLRVSYGTTGNDQIGDYGFLSLYNTSLNTGRTYQNIFGQFPGALTNPYLQWEETTKSQIGIDLGFAQDKIVFSSTYSQNRSSNQIVSYQLPIITGRGDILRNFPATVENVNWEFSLNATNSLSSNLQWQSNLNLTIPRNKLVKFPALETSTYKDFLILGEPTTISKAYPYVGVDPNTGKYQFRKVDGSITSTPTYPDDYNLIYNNLPRIYGGIQNNIKYKNISLDFLFQFVKQSASFYYYYYAGFNQPGYFSATKSNQPATVLNRWQKPGDIADLEPYSTSFSASFNNLLATAGDRNRADASYIRLKSLNLSIEVPQSFTKKLKITSCDFYINGQNLWTATNYYGLDPETQSLFLPPLRIWTIGIKASL